MKLAFTLILTTFFLNGKGQQATDTSISSELKLVHQNGYKIYCPIYWDIDTSHLLGTDFFIFSPIENDSDKFRENVNLIIRSITDTNQNLIYFKNLTENLITTSLTNSKMEYSSIDTKENVQFYKLIYEFTQGNLDLKIQSYFFIKNNKSYTVSFTAEKEKYERYREIGERILSYFHLVN